MPSRILYLAAYGIYCHASPFGSSGKSATIGYFKLPRGLGSKCGSRYSTSQKKLCLQCLGARNILAMMVGNKL